MSRPEGVGSCEHQRLLSGSGRRQWTLYQVETLATHVQKCTHLMASRGRTWDHAKQDADHGEQQHYGRCQDVGKIALRHHKESEGMKSLGDLQ